MLDIFVEPDPTLGDFITLKEVIGWGRKTAAAHSSSSSKVAGVFDHMGSLLDNSWVEETGAIFQFELSGMLYTLNYDDDDDNNNNDNSY